MKLVAKTLAFVGLPVVLCVLLPLSLAAWGKKSAPDQPSRSPDKWSLLSSDEITDLRMAFLADECEKYKGRCGSWPTQMSQIQWLLPPDKQEICFDAWGREFHLLAYANNPSNIYLETYGPDGVPGGAGSLIMTLP